MKHKQNENLLPQGIKLKFPPEGTLGSKVIQIWYPEGRGKKAQIIKQFFFSASYIIILLCKFLHKNSSASKSEKERVKYQKFNNTNA